MRYRISSSAIALAAAFALGDEHGRRIRLIEISGLEGPVAAARRRHQPGHLGSEQGLGPQAGAAADAGVSGDLRGEPQRSSWPAGRVPTRHGRCIPTGMPRMMLGDAADGNHHHARDHLHDVRDLQQLRRIFTDGRAWPENDRAELRRLLDRPMGGHRRRRPLRHAGGRDPRHQGPAQLRQQRNSVPQGQAGGRQGAHLPRQGQSERAAQRGHDHRQRADPALDGEAQLSPPAERSSRSGRNTSAPRTTATSADRHARTTSSAPTAT